MKAWREIAIPHKDVLEGSFKQSEFAADLTQVISGTAPEEYKNGEKFFSRTFITEGMRLLLISVAQRLAGRGGDPVIQLQTSFGGGKTHAMIAVYHLAKHDSPLSKMAGIPTILDSAGINDLPKAKVAVIDGNNLSVSEPKKRGSLTVNTIWGELAWQLLGEPGYKVIENSDKDGTSPGKEKLVELLSNAAPCVVLIDELVAFIRNLDSGKSYAAGTFESNLSFIQALTEAFKAVPNAILLASLPESEVEAVGPMGKLALDSLEKYFGRVESVWKPVATEESFEIVKRRLFETAGDKSQIEKICKSYFDYYIENNNRFPSETQQSHYLERLVQSYPIHPEVFDRLYEDWSTLEKFQRTRGVLQYLAIVIHRLWNSENRDPMIMPGSIPLDDLTVRTKSIHYLPQGWEPIIESEIDGPRSHSSEIDGKEPKFGQIQAAKRVARTIFMGSAPANYSQKTKGVSLDKILLGSCIPSQVVGTYEDVLKRLRDKLQYLFSDNDRYWFDTRPNLRREMESRKTRLSYPDHIAPEIKTQLQLLLRGSSFFGGVHVFAKTEDVPDDIGNGPRLVVFEPDSFGSYSKGNTSVLEKAIEFLRKRGETPRQRQNRLIFLAAEYDSTSRLKENAKSYLAWKSIIEDIDDQKINLDMVHIQQARKSFEESEKVFIQSAKETYKWLINPYEDVQKGKHELKWEFSQIGNTMGKTILPIIESKLKEEEWVISEWSPIHLANILKEWYFKDETKDVVTKKVFNDMSCYIYLPRLQNEEVLKKAIEQGLMTEDFFGYAQGKEANKYLGLVLGSGGQARVDESSLLIEKNCALDEKMKVLKGAVATNSMPGASTNVGTVENTPSIDVSKSRLDVPAKTQMPKRYWASVDLQPQKAKLEFGQIMDEVLIHLTSRYSTAVNISIEISAADNDGFDEQIQRTLKENCRSLSFKQSEFSDE